MNNELIEFSNMSDKKKTVALNKKINFLISFLIINFSLLISLLTINTISFMNNNQLYNDAQNINNNINLITNSSIITEIGYLINYTCNNLIDCH